MPIVLASTSKFHVMNFLSQPFFTKHKIQNNGTVQIGKSSVGEIAIKVPYYLFYSQFSIYFFIYYNLLFYYIPFTFKHVGELLTSFQKCESSFNQHQTSQQELKLEWKQQQSNQLKRLSFKKHFYTKSTI